MSVGSTQKEFTLDIASLIFFAYEQGYELTFGDAFRDPRVHGRYGEKESYATADSEHKRRLAVDFNLFKDGKYLTETSDHKMLGDYWESINPKNIWGGRWDDGNHYQRNT